MSYSGFVNGQDTNILSGRPELSTAAETNSPVGSYAITVSQGTLGVADTNYSLGFVDGTLTVTQAMLTVKAEDQTRVYGATNGPLTASSSGFVNGQDTNILSGSVELSTVAETNSPVGAYAITVSQGTLSVADTNYSLAFVEGVLTVTQAVLSVTADNQVRVYGMTNPAFTGMVVRDSKRRCGCGQLRHGGRDQQPGGKLRDLPALSGAAVSNYLVVTNAGMLTVTLATLSLTADDRMRPYGAANPVFSGTIVGLQNEDDITATYSTEAALASSVGMYIIWPTLEAWRWTIT